ncbi:MAG: multidrug efflux RND transporter permease subunit [Desulfovibrio sp.]|jgi:multidrug efflux pump|nr:multidrug efflux RND transporter permease subunit [Desulfovibrio sp.]
MATSTKPNFFLRRPVLSAVISIVITLVGALAMKALPVAQYPDLVPPTVVVNVFYPGASAETISSTVLAPLETAINGVENMLYMTSTASSGSGSGTVTIYFALGSNPDMALVNVNNKVNMAQPTLPETVRRQGVTVYKRSPSILQVLACHSPDGRYDTIFLNNFMQTNIADELKRVRGVGDVIIFGSMDYSIRIWLKPDLLGKYGLTVMDVANAVQDQNAQFAPGRLGDQPAPDSSELTWQIDARGRLVTPQEFGEIIVRTGPDSATLCLKDVAEITLGAKDYSVASEYNGRPARLGGIFLLPGANAIATGELVKARLQELSANFPEGFSCEVIVDTNEFVVESIKEVVTTLMEAMILVFIVVFVFLQNWRATLIPCIAVPVSIIGTFAGLYALGYTINTLTLFAMVLSIGIVVDDAIVVLENVERIMRTEHLPVREATVKAMNEVTAPIIAIVLVLCAVFIPVSFIGGLAGQMYRQFAVTISVSVTLSGIVALTLTPALCGLLLKPHAHDYRPARFFVWFNYFFANVTHHYLRAVRIVKNSSLRALLLFGLMTVVVVWLFRIVPSGLVPNEDQGYALGLAILSDGASQQRTVNATRKIADVVLKDPSVRRIVSINGFDITSSSVKSNYGTFFISMKPWEERTKSGMSSTDLTHKVMRVTMMQPDAVVLSFEPPPISGMSTTGGFEGFIQMRGSGTIFDLEKMSAKVIAEALSTENGQKKYPAIGSARSLFSTGAPQLYANLDRERCKDMGVSVTDVFTAMSATFGSYYINDFNYIGRTFQVRMQSDASYRMLPDSISDVFVRNAGGAMIPLSALMTLERRTAPETMDRYNVFPAARFMGDPAPGYVSGQALEAMEKAADVVLSTDYNLGWIGSSLQEKLASADTLLIFVLALLMVFLILAAQYESWALPLSVLTAVPFGVFGALTAIWLRDLSNDVYFQVALITLVGLASKNAILIVEFAVEAWRGGRALDVAAMHASRLRFRPIVMTSFAFILGCVPLAASTGAGANSRHAIGTAVVGGMLAATCIATLFVPYFFKLIMQLSLKLRGKKDPHEGIGSLDEEDV